MYPSNGSWQMHYPSPAVTAAGAAAAACRQPNAAASTSAASSAAMHASMLARSGMSGPGMPGPGMSGPGMSGPGMSGPGMSGPGMPGPGMSGPGMPVHGMPGPGMPVHGMPGPGMPYRMPVPNFLSKSQLKTQLRGTPASQALVPWQYHQGDMTQTGASNQEVNFVHAPDECALCVDNKKDLHIFLSCKHYPYCSECIKRLGQLTPGLIKCPTCKQQVEEVQPIKKMTKVNPNIPQN